MNQMNRREMFMALSAFAVLRSVMTEAQIGPAADAHEVTNLNDSGSGSLRAAFAAAAAGDVITFAPGLAGTINLASQLVCHRAVTLTGNVGPDGKPVITLSGGNSHAILHFNNMVLAAGTVEVRNLIFVNAKTVQDGPQALPSGAGSALSLENNAQTVLLNLTNCVFRDNLTSHTGGGAVSSSGGMVTVADCVFENTAGGAANTTNNGDGGFLKVQKGLTVRNSSFVNGRGNNGGAIYVGGGTTVSIAGTRFEGNRGEVDGGAIYIRATDAAVIANSTFRDNSSITGGGGAISTPLSPTTLGAMSISNTVFEENVATQNTGGAIAYGGGGTLTVTGSTFARNRADRDTIGQGGAISNRASQAATVVDRCTFDSNASKAAGGAIKTAGIVLLKNSTLTGNSGTIGPAVHSNYEIILVNTIVTGSRTSSAASVKNGALFTPNGTTTSSRSVYLFHSSMTDNEGGAIYIGNISRKAYLINSIVVGNYKKGGAASQVDWNQSGSAGNNIVNTNSLLETAGSPSAAAVFGTNTVTGQGYLYPLETAAGITNGQALTAAGIFDIWNLTNGDRNYITLAYITENIAPALARDRADRRRPDEGLTLGALDLNPLPEDTTPPEITVEKTAAVYEKNSAVSPSDFLADIGAAATDDTDGTVAVGSDFAEAVKLDTLGVYTVTLYAVDAANNAAEREVTVTVRVPAAGMSLRISCISDAERREAGGGNARQVT
jgi:hypothetical protein